MTLITPIIRDTACPTAETALRGFLLGQSEALVSAAALLGGEPALRRTARLLEEMVDAPRLTRRLRHGLVDLHRLLSLDYVDDLDSLEASCFAELDPASPVVAEICVLTDTFHTHLVALAEAEEDEPAWEALVAA